MSGGLEEKKGLKGLLCRSRPRFDVGCSPAAILTSNHMNSCVSSQGTSIWHDVGPLIEGAVYKQELDLLSSKQAELFFIYIHHSVRKGRSPESCLQALVFLPLVSTNRCTSQ